MSFSDNGNGTGSLSGTTAVAAGTYSADDHRHQRAAAPTSQTITLTVKAAGTKVPVPTFTSAAAATAYVGYERSASRSPRRAVPTTTTTNVTRSGTLPAGVTFTNKGNGQATLTGTPTAASGGTYPITLHGEELGRDDDPVVRPDRQREADDHDRRPAPRPPMGSAFNFTVKTTGAPAPTLAESGALPAGPDLGRQRQRHGHPGRHPRAWVRAGSTS